MNLSGVILDVYDDSSCVLLRRMAEEVTDFQKVAAASLLDVAELDRLPDRLFALVGTSGGEPIRKYAMHDEAHLRTSLYYFDQVRHLFDAPTQQKIAANLVVGCQWYDVRPPPELLKLAMAMKLLNTGLNALTAVDAANQTKGVLAAGRARGAQNMSVLRMNQSGAKLASGRSIQLSDEQAAAMQRGEGPESGHIFGPLSEFSNKERTQRKMDQQDVVGSEVKRADLNGSEAMTHQAARSLPLGKSPVSKIESKTSAFAWGETGELGAAPAEVRKVAHQHYALPHQRKYPIDTAEQVKRASAYFDEYERDMDLTTRRLFAISVVNRAEELSVKVAGNILAYGGSEFGPFIEAELHARANSFAGTDHAAVYEVLLERHKTAAPTVVMEMLKLADAATGADRSYGRPGVGFRNPVEAVYGGTKLAAEQPAKSDIYSWRSGVDYVSGQELIALAKRPDDLDRAFGDGFAKTYEKDPVAIFESMPDPQKMVLSRLAASSR
jgi:hypothetical protein